MRQRKAKDVHVWNQLLASIIPKITESRELFVDRINELLSSIFSELTGREDNLELHYRSDLDKKTNPDENSIFSFLQDKLDSEIEKGFLCYGPHKDQFWLTLDDRKDKQSFSQGEYRITFLALQLSINSLIREKLGFNPIILLDDIFSELDQNVFNKTIDYIYQRNNQVFVSATEIPQRLAEKGNTYLIQDGKLISQSVTN